MMNRRNVLALILSGWFVAPCLAGAPAVGPMLQATSVNIKSMTGSGGVQGSGTIFLLPKQGDNQQAWVITAHHVVNDQRHVNTVIDSGGKERKVVRYDDVQVVQERQTNDSSRIVGDLRMDAKVISVDPVRDIALLLVRARGQFQQGGRFYTKDIVPVAGTCILHCGAPGGQEIGGSATLTSGIISRTGVRIREYGGSEEGIYDQVDCAGMGGSSGGMVCLAENGAWIGMITLGLRGGDNFHWFVPFRNVQQWAKTVGVEWLFAKDAKARTEEEIKQIPLEVGAAMFRDSKPATRATHDSLRSDNGDSSSFQRMILRRP